MAPSSSTLRADYRRLSDLFARVNARTQTLTSGFLTVDGAADAAAVQLVWAKKDLVNNATNSFHVQHHVSALSQQDKTAVHHGGFPSSWDAAFTSVSPSGKSVVTLKLDKASDPPEGVFSVFAGTKLEATFKAPKTLHGAIYLGEREGGFAWSHDETKVAYVAEKKLKESPPFWENVNGDKSKKEGKDADEEGKNAESVVLPGNKFLFEDDWGERYVGKKTGAIFVATLATGKIDEVKGIPDNITSADVAFTPGDKGLVFAGTETDNPRRLGIIYCYNRHSSLYEVVFNDEDPSKNTVTKVALTPASESDEQVFGSIRSPRFSPDGKRLAFLGTRDISTHGTCSFLGVIDWATKKAATIVPIQDEPEEGYSNPDKFETAFNGLFTGSLGVKAWSADGEYIFFDAQVGSRVVWKYVQVATRKILSPSYVDGSRVAIETVLDRADNHVLVSVSSPTRAASVFLVTLDLATGNYKQLPIAIEDQKDSSPYIKDWHTFAIPTSVSDIPAAQKKQPETPAVLQDLLIPQVSSEADYEAAVILPATEAPAAGYPVILDLHGGPHGNSPVMYRPTYDFLASLGFAIMSVNYRGSTGYGIKALESLVGRVGTQDVYDCHYALLHILNKREELGLPALDTTKLHCSGGSHGGFLVHHLIAQFPGFYKSTVTRNPVANIASMFYTTDIPDWILAAVGVQRFESIHSTRALQEGKEKLPALTPEVRLAILNKFWQHSPVGNDLSKVSTPVLYGLGGKDRRVPPNQGLEYHNTIKHHGVETRLLWYPDDSHPLDSVQAYGDFAINWGLWVLDHNN